MRVLLLIALLIAALQTQRAAEPTDFAYGRQLLIEPGAAVYELYLPEDVYRGVTRGDLGDLRVFDGSAAVVPHLLRVGGRRSDAPERAELPIFPVHAAGAASGEDLSLDVETGSGGAVVRMRRRPAGDAAVRAYLFDASALEKPIAALLVAFPAGGADGLTTVRVEGSDDLTRWTTIVASAVIGELTYGEHRLRQTRVPLPLSRSRYLRLTWSAGEAAPVLAGAAAELEATATAAARGWLDVDGTTVTRRPGVYEYDSGGVFPVDQVALRLPPNALLAASVYSRPSAGEPWRLRTRGIHHHLRTESGEIRSGPVDVEALPDRFWMLEVDGDAPAPPPVLQLGWTPHRLAFLATGEPPYLLAFGSAAAAGAGAPLDELLALIGGQRDAVSFLRPAAVGGAVALGGEARLVPRPAPVDWRRWLLWGVLIAGVAVLLTMVWRLSRQMAASSDPGAHG